MADVVIVVGTKRGKESVPVLEIKQMVGRAGRKHGGEAALANVIVEEDRIEDIRAGLEKGQNMDVRSSFGETDGLLFHLMPEIVSGKVEDVITAIRWFKRSLAASQGRKVNFGKLFDKLEVVGAYHRQEVGAYLEAYHHLGEVEGVEAFHHQVVSYQEGVQPLVTYSRE